MEEDSISKVKSLLDKEMKLIVNGNRLIQGKFVCFDKQQNLLLAHTQEEITLDKDENSDPNIKPNIAKKELGAVIVPLKYISSCTVLDQ